jgi:putative holliday junction resolvase
LLNQLTQPLAAMMVTLKSVLSLDVGEKRVGVAVASFDAHLPRPLLTLHRTDTFFQQLADIIDSEGAAAIVVGYPRGLDGQTTGQTRSIEAFVKELKTHIKLPTYFQDEAVTSKQAEAELKARGKPYQPGAIDALAATYILEDFIREHHNLSEVMAT